MYGVKGAMLRLWLWVAVLLVLVPSEGQALNCISCLNCKIYEVTSHTKECEPTATMCLRAGLKSGDVERGCATEQSCREATTKSAFVPGEIYCCNTDLCNAASRPLSPQRTMLVVSLVAATRFVGRLF